MKSDTKDVLDQITNHCAGKICEEKELQKAKIIKFLEKYRCIIGILSSIVIAIMITVVTVITLIILKEIPLKILL